MAGKGDNGLGVDWFVVDTAPVVPGLPWSLWDNGSVPVTFAAGTGGTGPGAADGTPGERGTFPLDAGGAASLVAALASDVSVGTPGERGTFPLDAGGAVSLVAALASDVSVPSVLRNRAVLRPRRERFDERGVSGATGKAGDGVTSPSPFCQIGSKRLRGRDAKRCDEAGLSLVVASHPELSNSAPAAVNAIRNAPAISWARA